MSESSPSPAPQAPVGRYHRGLCTVVNFLGLIAAAGLVAMVLITSLDVGLRVFHRSLTGAYDLVKIACALTVAAALPYTTAIKGHVAIEYFFQKLGPRGRVVVDVAMRLLGMALFGILAWGSIQYGNSLKRSGEVSLTLQLPVFWVPYVLAASCGLVVLIKLHHLTHPGRPMIKP
jgi:TRAP-type C4-dicarboxylate transport system permease small subunit